VRERQLYSIEEARELLGGISRNTIYGLMRSGDLASVQFGRRRFVSAAAIAVFIMNSTTTDTPARGLTASAGNVQMRLTLLPARPARRGDAPK